MPGTTWTIGASGSAGPARAATLACRRFSIGVAAAGGAVDTTGEQIRLTLPTDLADCYALRELKRLARDLGLMPKVVFPKAAADA